MGITSISLLSEDQTLTQLPVSAFEALVQQKKIELTPEDLKKGSESGIMERLSQASEKDLRIANFRTGFVDRYLREQALPAMSRGASPHALPLGCGIPPSRCTLWKRVFGLVAGPQREGQPHGQIA